MATGHLLTGQSKSITNVFTKSFQRGRYDFTIGRILAIREDVRLAASTCNIGWYLKETWEFRESRLKYQLKHPGEQYIPVLCFLLRQLFTQYLSGLKTKPFITKTNFSEQRARLTCHPNNCICLCRFLIPTLLEISRTNSCPWNRHRFLVYQDSATLQWMAAGLHANRTVPEFSSET